MASKISGASVATAILAILVVLTWSDVAGAEEGGARAAAKAKVEQGAALLEVHADARALAEFEGAYRIFPSPKIFFDIGLAHVGLGRNPDALRAFQRFLIEAPDASTEAIARAKTQVQSLLPKVAIVDVVCPQTGLEIIVDDTSVGRSPLTAPLYLNPGRHRVSAKGNEAAALSPSTFDVAGGARISFELSLVSPPPKVTLPPATTAAPPLPLIDNHGRPETEERRIYARPWFWAATAGVVAVVGATLALTLGRSTKDPSASLGRMTIMVSP